nr:reverse transcriptase domain-containing protein [Tanacetum cinerariifolium]
MAAEGNGDLPVPDLQTMEELSQPSLNGRGGPITLISIQATNFKLKNDMIQQVQNSCQFHGLGNLFPPLDNPELTIRRRSHTDPTLLNNYEMAAEGNDDLPVLDLRTIEELSQPSLNGRGGPITLISIQATNFGLKNDMIQQSIKVNGVTDDALRLYLFPHSLTHHATAWFDRLLRNSINTFEQMAKMFLEKYVPPSMVTKLRNEITNFCQPQQSKSSSSITSFDMEIAALRAEMEKINKNLMRVLQPPLATLKKYMMREPTKFMKMNTASSSGSGTLPSNTITNPKEDMKVLKRETRATKDTVHPTNNGSTKDVQPSVVETESPILNSEPIIAPIIEPVASLVRKLYFPADFVVVDFDADPRVPLILGRSFLKTERAFIDVFEGELTLRVSKEAITFNLDQTSRYSANYNDMMANRIDVIDMACEEYSQEVLGFFDVIKSGNPTPYYDPIVYIISPTLTPFRNSDFLLEEVDAFLALEDEPTSLEELKICEAKFDKSSIDEPPEVKLKDLPPHLEYVFLEGDDKLSVIIVKDLSVEDKTALITVLKSRKQAIAWKLSDIKRIDHEFYARKIVMEEDFEPAVQHQRRVNTKIHDVIKNEVLKLLDAGLIYPIFDSPWRLAGNQYYYFLDGFSGYFQIPIDLKDQEKTTFTCPYVTFAYRRMPFRLCNAPGMFQRCMMAIFHDMIEKSMEVFMDDFLVFGNSFQTCLSHLVKLLKRCEDTNLCLNIEKSYFMVKKGIVIGHKISKNGIEVDEAKVDVIAKLPHPTTVKGIYSFLGQAGFYRRFIQDFSKIARPMT